MSVLRFINEYTRFTRESFNAVAVFEILYFFDL